MYYKKFVKSVLSLILMPCFILLSAVVIIDPLQVFHKSWFHPNKYYFKSLREASYGIIKYENYDSIIIGSSMAENFSAKEASEKLGAKFINIAGAGATLCERKILLRHLLQQKPIKIIIYSFDEITDIGFINNYNQLYGSYFDKLHFYLNDELMITLKNSITNQLILVNNFDHPAAWYDYPEHKSRFGGFKNWIFAAIHGNEQARRSLKCIFDAVKSNNSRKISNIGWYKKQISECLISFVKQYPNTLFLLFLPPYHKIYWRTEISFNNEFEIYCLLIRTLVKESKNHNNMKIYGFDNESFTNDIKRYKDRVHYDKEINSFMLDAMRDKTHILTSENVDKYLKQLESESKNYDLKPFYDQIKDLKELQN
jgi:hypothetical protein